MEKAQEDDERVPHPRRSLALARSAALRLHVGRALPQRHVRHDGHALGRHLHDLRYTLSLCDDQEEVGMACNGFLVAVDTSSYI